MKFQASFLPEYDLIHYAQTFGPVVELDIDGQRVYVTHPFDSVEQLKTLCGTFQGRLEQAGKGFAGAVIQPAGEEPPTDPERYKVTGPVKVRLDYGPSRPWSVQDMDPPNQRRYEVAAADEPLKHPDTVIIPPNEWYPQGVTEQQIVDYYDAVRPIIVSQYQEHKWDGLAMVKTDKKLVIKRHAEETKADPSQLLTIEYLNWRAKYTDFDIHAMDVNTDEAFGHLNRGRTVEFHFAVGGKTNVLWVDLDPGDSFPFEDVKSVALDMLEELKGIPNIDRFDVRFSGKTGFHVLGFLSQDMDTNEARDQVKALVRGYIDKKGDDRLVDKATKDPGQMRLDYSTLHSGGGLRLTYSLAYPTGLVCLTIPPAQVRQFQKEDARMDGVLQSARRGSLDIFGAIDTINDIGHAFDWWIEHQTLPDDPKDIPAIFNKLRQAPDNTLKLTMFLRKFLHKPQLTESEVLDALLKMEEANRNRLQAMQFDAALEEYQKKRKFDETPEPQGEEPGKADSPNVFVVQEHHAHKAGLHYDFRLGSEGVLKSWAIPKLPALMSGTSKQVLAIEVEDHPLDYAAFEGSIPSGYGAGDVKIWDDGSYTTVSRDENHWKFRVQGQHMKGAFTLFRVSGKNWNLRRAKEDAA